MALVASGWPGNAGKPRERPPECSQLWPHARINIKMIDQGSSESNIIVGIRNEDFEDAIRAIYDVFVTTEI